MKKTNKKIQSVPPQQKKSFLFKKLNRKKESISPFLNKKLEIKEKPTLDTERYEKSSNENKFVFAIVNQDDRFKLDKNYLENNKKSTLADI